MNDVLKLDCLEAVVQRIGLAYWESPGVLRSWGIAPLFLDDGTLLVPCAPDEALWLGAWYRDADSGSTPHAPSKLTLRDERATSEGRLIMPEGYQLASLAPASGDPSPVCLPSGTSDRALVLEWQKGELSATLNFKLLRPSAWAERAGREPPPPLSGPPALPPLLG